MLVSHYYMTVPFNRHIVIVPHQTISVLVLLTYSSLTSTSLYYYFFSVVAVTTACAIPGDT